MMRNSAPPSRDTLQRSRVKTRGGISIEKAVQVNDGLLQRSRVKTRGGIPRPQKLGKNCRRLQRSRVKTRGGMRSARRA